MANKARHAFGSEANVDSALEAGTINAYDILFLDEKKIGWIDKNGKKVILEDAVQVSVVTALPEAGAENILYIVVDATTPDSITVNGHIWNGTQFVPAFSNATAGSGGVDETMVDSKIEAAMTVVEF